MTNANARSVGGTHYKGPQIEHWDYAVIALNNRYLEGNITKYVARHRLKHGTQDLEKAKHYLQKLRESVHVVPVVPPNNPVIMNSFILRFCDQNNLSPIEQGIMLLMADWKTTDDLQAIDRMIDELLELSGEPGPSYVNQGG